MSASGDLEKGVQDILKRGRMMVLSYFGMVEVGGDIFYANVKDQAPAERRLPASACSAWVVCGAVSIWTLRLLKSMYLNQCMMNTNGNGKSESRRRSWWALRNYIINCEPNV
jgi:hypothetical protein